MFQINPQLKLLDFTQTPQLSVEERKEITLLRELGLDNGEISYLMRLRVKQRLSEKWDKHKRRN